MTSLLQFTGTIGADGVHLMFYLVGPDEPPRWRGDYTHTSTDPQDMYKCAECTRQHPVIYTAARKPCGLFGPWVQFRYLGKVQVPDLSTPIRVPRLPRGAKRMTNEDATRYWHS